MDKLVSSFAGVVAGAFLWPGIVVAQTVEETLKHRPVSLPTLAAGDSCPVTTGSVGTVPRQRHIFGGALWFGAGPVYFALAWKDSPGDDATFALEPVPLEGDAYRAKTPWVATPCIWGPSWSEARPSMLVVAHFASMPRVQVRATPSS